MGMLVHDRPRYSRAERISDGVVHVIGVAGALMAVPVLITLTALRTTDTAAITAACIYGVSLILMLLASALYNMIDHPDWTDLLRRIDYSFIYFKIAGTYTPFALLAGGPALYLLTGIWGAAFAGAGLRVFSPTGARWMGIAIYLAMGWAGVFAGSAFLSSMSLSVLILAVVGGVLYTLGLVVFLQERLRFHNTIWHVFVLAASVIFFIAIAMHMAQGAA
ncbi:MAG: hemolysin III family protein [Pseudomonadota bacterium]